MTTKKLQCCLFICIGFALFILFIFYDYYSKDFVFLHKSLATPFISHGFSIIDGKLEKDILSLNSNNYSNNNLFLIGIGCAKCGSTFFNRQFYYKSKLSKNFNQTKYELNIALKETQYWTKCLFTALPIPDWILNINEHFDIINGKKFNVKSRKIMGNCNFNEYMNSWNMALEKVMQSNVILIFIEKTPSYLKYVHASYFLSFYAHILPLKFYLLLRNPQRKVWSSYWMTYNAHHRNINIADRNMSAEVSDMQHMIQSKIDNFPIKNTIFWELLKMMENKNNSTVNFSGMKTMVDLYIKSVYDPYSALQISPLIAGCYYPQLLTWYYIFNYMVEQNFNRMFSSEQRSDFAKGNVLQFEYGLKIEDRLRIIQSEFMFKHTNQVIEELLIWRTEGNKGTFHVSNVKRISVHSSSAAPSNVNVKELEIYSSLEMFYNKCNAHLYSFLELHPSLMLGERIFNVSLLNS